MKATWKSNLIAIGTMIISTSFLLNAKENQISGSAPVQAILRVNNQAGLTSHSLEVVKNQMLRLAGEAGIEITWLDCTKKGAELDQPAQCGAAVGAGEFVLNIRNFKDQEKGRDARQTALGHSWVTTQGGVYSSVFADVVHSLPVQNELQDKILGHAAAHEFGHLLLGNDAHSKQGVMRANWNKQDWAAMNVARLRFSQDESRRMQERLLMALNQEIARK